MSDLLKPYAVRVATEGSVVVLSLGNTALKMSYDDALTLSRWLRVRGKEAKRSAGDNSRDWRAVGTLESLEALREVEKQWWR